MGGGASSYKFHAELTVPNYPLWLANPLEKLLPISSSKFHILRAIGKGKFGLVFLARHQNNNKHVAIKFISKQSIHESKAHTRIQQEVYAIEKIDHPFLAHCFGGFQTNECIAFVFEFCVGGELYTFLKRRNKLSEEESKFYFCEIALAIAYLNNTLGIVYRDLKPENILIDYRGHLKLCDFGFAVAIKKERDGSDGFLHDGCGTAMYLAPEIAGGFMERAHSFPVDWWGLGCVLCEMMTGNAPFGDIDHTSKFQILTNITEMEPKLSYSMSKSSKILLQGLLEKDANKRYSWNDVKSSEFCKDVDWSVVLQGHISPPWKPTFDANSSSSSCDHFISWDDVVLPQKAPGIDVTNYCKTLKVPITRTSKFCNGMTLKE